MEKSAYMKNVENFAQKNFWHRAYTVPALYSIYYELTYLNGLIYVDPKGNPDPDGATPQHSATITSYYATGYGRGWRSTGNLDLDG